MRDYGFFLTRQAIRRQLTAMPNDLFLIRLVHGTSRSCCPGERLWTADLLTAEPTLRFLRARNRAGYDVYIHPYADGRNAGYVLLDLDQAPAHVLPTMRAQGCEPCVVLQSSPGHWQAWIRLSAAPLEPALATVAARHLAHTYHADRASADWRHLGRLAGFTNQKPQRRGRDGYAPWVRLLYARAGFATQAEPLLQSLRGPLGPHTLAHSVTKTSVPVPPLPATTAAALYQACLHQLRIPQRFPHPDWSIADKWVAKELLRRGTPPARVQAILLGSPGFPRRHCHPQDYLCRTLARAAQELRTPAVPRPPTPPCF